MSNQFRHLAAANELCPFDMYEKPGEWATWMYQHGVGSLPGMHDYAIRHKLWRDVKDDEAVTESVRNVLRHLLNIRKGE